MARKSKRQTSLIEQDTTNKSVKVSVIIPVYNSELYIKECIDSLLMQTLEDFEIICVNDGSTDGTDTLLCEYLKKDKRIKVIEQENSGAGAARNNGYNHSCGEYVIFLDSDDFFSENLLDSTYSYCKENNADMVIFNGMRFDNVEKVFLDKCDFLRPEMLPKNKVFSRQDIPDNILRIVSPAPYTRLYSRKFLERINISYQNLANSNDFYFGIMTLALAERICCINECLIYYRINNQNSLQSQKNKNMLCSVEAIKAIYHGLKEKNVYDDVQRSFQAVALSSLEFNLRTCKTVEGRGKLLEALSDTVIAEMDFFDHEPDHYINNTIYTYACRIRNAVDYYNYRSKFLKNTETSLVVENRSDTEIQVSVIVPVYNTQAYLVETICSLIDQTFREMEIICIDDGSTDSSLSLLKKIAALDPRISVYTQPNRGQSFARNMGISAAKGKYFYFMDSDDILEKNAIELCHKVMEENGLDIVYFDADVFCANEISSFNVSDRFNKMKANYTRSGEYSGIMQGNILFEKMKAYREYSPSVCLQMFSKKFLASKGLNFHNGIIYEDNIFSFAAALEADRVMHLNKTLYHRRIRDDSTMTKDVSFHNVYGYFSCYIDMMREYFKMSSILTSEQTSSCMQYINQVLKNAINMYSELSIQEKACEYGMGEDFWIFRQLVAEPANSKNPVQNKSTASNKAGAFTFTEENLKSMLGNIIQKDKYLLSNVNINFKLGDGDNAFYTTLRKAGPVGAEEIHLVTLKNNRKIWNRLVDKNGNRDWISVDEFNHTIEQMNKAINENNKMLCEQKKEYTDSLSTITEENKRLNYIISETRKSFSYRLAMFLTWLPRKIRGLLK